MKIAIKTKIILFLIIMVFLPTLLTSILIVYDTYSYNKDRIDNEVAKSLDEEINLLNRQFYDKKNMLTNAVNTLQVIIAMEFDSDEIIKKITDFSAVDEDVINAFITTANGQNYVSDWQEPKVDGRIRQWYIGASVIDDVFITKPYTDALTGQNVITLSRKLIGKDGKMMGVLGVDIFFDFYINRIKQINNKYDSKYLIVNEENELLFIDATLKNVQWEQLPQAESYLLEYEGIDYKVNRKSVDELKITIYVFTDSQVYYGKIKLISNILFIILIAVMAVLIPIGFITANKISLPIVLLNKAIIGDADTDFAEVKRISNFFETNKLADYFVTLNSTVKRKISELQNTITVLEHKNLELVEANIDLERSYTQLKEVDSRIRESEKMYNDMIKNINEFIWVVDSTGKVTYINEALLSRLGYEEDEIVGVNGELIFLCPFVDSLIEVLNKRNFDNIELKLKKKNSNDFISVSTSTVRAFDEGEVLFIHCLGRDIMEEKKLYNQYINRVFEQNMLNEITNFMTLNFELNKILSAVVQKISSYIDVEMCTIRLLDEFGYLNLETEYGSQKKLVSNKKIHIDDDHMGWSLNSNKVLILKSSDELLFNYEHDKNVFEIAEELIFLPLNSMNRRLGVISIASKEHVNKFKIKTLENLAKSTALAIEKSLLYDSLKDGYLKMIQVLSEAVDDKDLGLKGHTGRVSQYSVLLAKELYLEDRMIDDIRIAGLLHDIGKIGIKDFILLRKTKLSEEEYNQMRVHVEVGKKILEPIGLSDDILQGIYYHHKNFDLSGFPEDEVLKELPLFARIIQVASEFDHMIKEKNQLNDGVEYALGELRRGSGKEFCPQIVRIVEDIVDTKFDEIMRINNL